MPFVLKYYAESEFMTVRQVFIDGLHTRLQPGWVLNVPKIPLLDT